MTYIRNKEYIDKSLKDSFDISKRELFVENDSYYICFINSLTDAKQIEEVIKGLYQGKPLLDLFALYCASYIESNDLNSAVTSILSGQCLLLYLDKIYLIEVRNYPNRSSNEASNEQSIRGSHDSFVENIILNVGLIRRRIRNENLKIFIQQEGILTKTDIAYLYIENIVDKDMLSDFKNRLNNLKKVNIIHERTLCDALYGKTYNPYPIIRYCERPDLCAIHLMQGYIVLLVDNSFTSIIFPTTFFELTKQIEEYTQTSIVAVFIRFIRLLAIIFSIYLLPIWLCIQTLEKQTLLNIPLINVNSKLLFEIIFIEILIEWIRLSFIHTPKSINGIMGFLFVFLLGESAVNTNFYTEIILVIVVLSNICNFVTPNYELSYANKLSRILLTILTVLFSINGFALGIIIHYLLLVYNKSIYITYTYPLIPFDLKEIKRLLLGSPTKFTNKHR